MFSHVSSRIYDNHQYPAWSPSSFLPLYPSISSGTASSIDHRSSCAIVRSWLILTLDSTLGGSPIIYPFLPLIPSLSSNISSQFHRSPFRDPSGNRFCPSPLFLSPSSFCHALSCSQSKWAIGARRERGGKVIRYGGKRGQAYNTRLRPELSPFPPIVILYLPIIDCLSDFIDFLDALGASIPSFHPRSHRIEYSMRKILPRLWLWILETEGHLRKWM